MLPLTAQDEEGVVHVPPAVLAAFDCLRDAAAGSWSGELQAEVPAFFVVFCLGRLRGLANAPRPPVSGAWVEAAEVRRGPVCQSTDCCWE